MDETTGDAVINELIEKGGVSHRAGRTAIERFAGEP